MDNISDDLVSIIVPVYNCELFLHRCIDSILEQSYQKLEIILVDDESDDLSRQICNEYQKRDSRVKVYGKRNGGVSDTRNYALSKVQGRYIQFVDADDYIRPHMTEIMVQTIKKQEAQMAVCGYVRVFSKIKLGNVKKEHYSCYSNVEYIQNTIKDPGHYYYGVVWNKLYLNEIIQRNHLRFNQAVSLGEDFLFNLSYLNCIQKVTVLSKRLYCYNRSGHNSLSQRNNKDLSFCKWELKNRKMIYEFYCKDLKKLGLYEKHQKRIERYWILFYVRQLFQIRYEFKSWSEEEIKEWLEILDGIDYIQESRKHITRGELLWWMYSYRCFHRIKLKMKKYLLTSF